MLRSPDRFLHALRLGSYRKDGSTHLTLPSVLHTAMQWLRHGMHASRLRTQPYSQHASAAPHPTKVELELKLELELELDQPSTRTNNTTSQQQEQYPSTPSFHTTTCKDLSSTAEKKKHVWLYDVIQPVPYQLARTTQLKLREERMKDDQLALHDIVVILEHPPVYTLGARASKQHVLFDENDPPQGSSLHRIERGGEVTFHGPGQIVCYPIMNLRNHKKDLKWYLSTLEQVVIDTCGDMNLEAYRVDGRTGVWVDDRKICAIGVAASKWVTMHGFALNVTTDMEWFKKIVPCGISDKAVTSLAEFYPNVTTTEIRKLISSNFSRLFDVKMMRVDVPFFGPDARA